MKSNAVNAVIGVILMIAITVAISVAVYLYAKQIEVPVTITVEPINATRAMMMENQLKNITAICNSESINISATLTLLERAFNVGNLTPPVPRLLDYGYNNTNALMNHTIIFEALYTNGDTNVSSVKGLEYLKRAKSAKSSLDQYRRQYEILMEMERGKND